MSKLLATILGLVFVVAGIFMVLKGNELKRICTAKAVGTIVGIKTTQERDTDGVMKYTYYPIIEYKANDKNISKQASTGTSSSSKYKINDKVDILYNPNNVEEFIFKGEKGLDFFGVFFIILGGIVVIVSIKQLLTE